MEIDKTLAFCLNLTRRPDRKLQAWQQFRREKLVVARITASDAVNVEEARGWRNKGMRACAAAHRLVWRAGRKAGAQASLIFEDDVVLCPGFRQRLDELELPEDWGIVYFGCVLQTQPVEVSPGLLRITGPVWDMHAYLIRREFAEELSREYSGVCCRGRIRPGLTDRETAAQGAGWWSLSPKERGRRRVETSNDTIVPQYFGRYAAYTVWPPMAWQVTGLSNNENSIRGNYRKDGTQRLCREAIRGLPGVADGDGEREGKREGEIAKSVMLAVQQGESGRREGAWNGAGMEDGRASMDVAAPPANRPVREMRGPGPAQRSRGERLQTGPRGILLSPYSAESERMAYALVKSLRRYNAHLPVAVVAQDYLCGLDWRGLATVRSVRAVEPHRTPRMWFNKLAALLMMPFEETLFLDCDIYLFSDPAWWFEHLGTDDLTYFTIPFRVSEQPDVMVHNNPNPHRMKEIFGVEAAPIIDGAGHFFIRRTDRARMLVGRISEVMQEAMDRGPASLYWRIAGEGNIPCSDELAASIVMVEQRVKVPEAIAPEVKPIAVYMPPWQKEAVFDFDGGSAVLYDEWSRRTLRPGAVHFCGVGKQHRPYLEKVARQCGKPPIPTAPGNSTASIATPHIVRQSQRFHDHNVTSPAPGVPQPV